MDGATNLLIEENITRKASDVVIRPKGEFAEKARSWISIQCFEQVDRDFLGLE